MKKLLDVLKQKMAFIKEKFFTKHEKEHSEKFYKVIDILNKYSFVWHAFLSMFVVFLVELASRWSILSSFNFIAKTPLVFLYNSFIFLTSILFKVDKKIDDYENKKQKLEELKKGLMQQLLTGKIRV